MKTTKLFWWSPRRALRLVLPEVRHNSAAWLHLGRETKRPLFNFGDELSPLIVQAISGRKVEWSAAHSADMVAVGSVFELATRTASSAAVWGTGLRANTDAEGAERLLNNIGPILAVRGPNTRSALRLTETTPLGDPGLLATRLIDRARDCSDSTLVIPHFSAWNSRHGRRQIMQLRTLGFQIAQPSLEPMDMIGRIARARFVLSSSLHGVVIAHALGVPTQLLVNSTTSVREPMWKYHDYFASLGSAVNTLEFDCLEDARAVDQAFVARESDAASLQDAAGTLAAELESALRTHLA
ncbi:polysaccharide pyruvyl transferase family protein [Leifsonia kafniensis]|uniref:Polysaccharide pyruvyl transferase family protein n=1 Tax=Leifsonia kafniensis TaxID=475957 RepID=A0ABP7LAX4_9MICO